MTIVQLFPRQTGISAHPGLNLSCLQPLFVTRSASSVKFRTTFARQSSQTSRFRRSSPRSLKVSHDLDEPQLLESRFSAETELCSSGRDERGWHSLFSIQRMELTSYGPAEILALGLVAGVLLFPEQSWAVDMEAGTTAQGFMGWAAIEPANALSLPTWVIHVASVAEWVTAMVLVWKYGDMPGKSSWKGLTWGMVPLLGGAMCACTWHFFYNDPSLEVLVVLQAFLTVVGNCTMWAAAYRIWKASQEKGSVG
ncbi:hypothetical protein Mapa_001966 [Marchantia paleacea]|nr:hypothetical protein Mapa_001966 [Marchantia paleacea]